MGTQWEREEFQEIPIGTEPGQMAPKDVDNLTSGWRILTGRSPSSFFDFGPGSIRPKNWAGFISVSGTSLQVSPKGSSHLSGFDRALLDKNISEMLRLSLTDVAVPLGMATMDLPGSRFDRALEVLCDSILLARRRRVLRRYVVRTEPTRGFRGQVDWARQPLYRSLRPGVFLSREVELDEGTPANIFLKSSLLTLRRMSKGRLSRRVDEVLVALDRVPTFANPLEVHALIRLDRLPEDYRQAIVLAKQLLEGGAGGLFAGARRAQSEVVFMPELFEAFVWRLFRDESRGLGLHPTRKQPGRFLGAWDSGPQLGRQAFEIETDAEAAQMDSHALRVVVDAKWKWPLLTGPSMGIDSSDIYQMIAYGSRLRSERMVLVFPSLSVDGGFVSRKDLPSLKLAGTGCPKSIAIAFVPLLCPDIRQAGRVLGWALTEEAA